MKTYQFDCDSFMSHKVHSEIDATVRTLSKNIEQFVSFAQNSRHFPHDVDVLRVWVGLVWRIGCSSSSLLASMRSS